MAPDHVLEDLRRALVGLDRAGDRLERAGSEVVAALDQADELVDHGRGAADVVVVAVEREHVSPQVDVAAEPALELAKDGVLGAGELGGNAVIERELASRQGSPTGRRPAAREPLR